MSELLLGQKYQLAYLRQIFFSRQLQTLSLAFVLGRVGQVGGSRLRLPLLRR